MIHYRVESANVAEYEIEQPLREYPLHQADEVLREGDALIEAITLHGLQGLARDDLRILDLEE